MFVYILYSEKLSKYYIGSTHDIDLRIERHNTDYYENKWSSKGKPWQLYFSIECKNITQARKIENHIKKMKSKKYIENLSKYSEITEKLLEKYRGSAAKARRVNVGLFVLVACEEKTCPK